MVLDPRARATLYAGHHRGLYKTEDGGRSWRNVLPGAFAKAIAVDPGDGTVYVANSAHLWRGWWEADALKAGIYRSRDGGATWAMLSDGDLMNHEFLCLTLDRGMPGRLWVGTVGNGVFVGEPRPDRQGRIGLARAASRVFDPLCGRLRCP